MNIIKITQNNSTPPTNILTFLLELVLFSCSSNKCLIHTLLLRQSVRLPLDSAVPMHLLWSTCVTYGMPWHARGDQMLPKTFPRETEDFLRDSEYPEHVRLLTFFAYLPPIWSNTCNYYIYMSKSWTIFFVVKILTILEEGI